MTNKMSFADIYNRFTPSTKENFPVNKCIIQNKREPTVFDSESPYLCLMIDQRFEDWWTLIVLYPYICKESPNVTTFSWADKDGNVYGNIENSTQLYDEFVVAFAEYSPFGSIKKGEKLVPYDVLFNSFLRKIDKQYE